jgi:hypothetical protein
MNTIRLLFERILPLLGGHLPACVRQRARPTRKLEIQLEFPWPRQR